MAEHRLSLLVSTYQAGKLLANKGSSTPVKKVSASDLAQAPKHKGSTPKQGVKNVLDDMNKFNESVKAEHKKKK